MQSSNHPSRLLSRQRLPDPIQLHSTHPPGIAPIREDKFIVHDGFHLLPKQHAGRVDGHRLITHHRPVAAVRNQTGRVGCESTQERFEDEHHGRLGTCA